MRFGPVKNGQAGHADNLWGQPLGPAWVIQTPTLGRNPFIFCWHRGSGHTGQNALQSLSLDPASSSGPYGEPPAFSSETRLLRSSSGEFLSLPVDVLGTPHGSLWYSDFCCEPRLWLALKGAAGKMSKLIFSPEARGLGGWSTRTRSTLQT